MRIRPLRPAVDAPDVCEREVPPVVDVQHHVAVGGANAHVHDRFLEQLDARAPQRANASPGVAEAERQWHVESACAGFAIGSRFGRWMRTPFASAERSASPQTSHSTAITLRMSSPQEPHALVTAASHEGHAVGGSITPG
jgi:hypothetical protein